MNGPYSKENLPDNESTLADYTIACGLFYTGFAWSKAELAYETMRHIAEKYRVGFFDVGSNSSDVWLPDVTGKLARTPSG